VEVFKVVRDLGGLDLEIYRDPGLMPETHKLLQAVMGDGRFKTEDEAIRTALLELLDSMQRETHPDEARR
jgi:hypothetical protein